MEQQVEYQMPEMAKVGFDHRAVCGLAPRLAKAMEAIDKRLEKRGFNKEFKFKYATAEDVKAAARSALAEQEIAVIPMIREVHPIAIGRKDSPGMRAVMDFIVACPEGAVTVPWHADAMDFGDKAINKCVTIGLKVFLIALLQIPTGDEPDPDANGTGDDEPETARRGPAPKRRAKSGNGAGPKADTDDDKKTPRPYKPEMVKHKLQKLAGTGKTKNDPKATDKQVGFIASLLNQAFDGRSDPDGCRLSVLNWLWGPGLESSKVLTMGEASATITWLKDQDGDGALHPDAKTEAHIIYRRTLRERGQLELLPEGEQELAEFEGLTDE